MTVKEIKALTTWETAKVIREVKRLSVLLDTEEFVESMFVDDANDLLDILKDECVKRLEELTS